MTTAKRIKRRFKKIEAEMAGDSYDVAKIRGQLASAKGQLKHCCSHNLKQSIKLDELTTELIRKESKK